MNIATDITINGANYTVYGDWIYGREPKYECADDDNGNAVELNDAGVQLATDALAKTVADMCQLTDCVGVAE